MSDWYYQAMGGVQGPVSFEELRQLADRGDINERTLARQGGGRPMAGRGGGPRAVRRTVRARDPLVG